MKSIFILNILSKIENSLWFLNSPLDAFKGGSFSFIVKQYVDYEYIGFYFWFKNNFLIQNFNFLDIINILKFLIFYNVFTYWISYIKIKQFDFFEKVLFFLMILNIPILIISTDIFINHSFVLFSNEFKILEKIVPNPFSEKIQYDLIRNFSEASELNFDNIISYTFNFSISFWFFKVFICVIFPIVGLIGLLSQGTLDFVKFIKGYTLETMLALGEKFYKMSLSLYFDIVSLKTFDIKNEENKKVAEYRGLFIFFHTIYIYILSANLCGMIPFTSTITANLCVTFFIASTVFLMIAGLILYEKGLNYFLSLFLPSGCPITLAFLLIPIEFLSYNFRVVSLSVRLFANMMAGHTLLKVIIGFSWSFLIAGELLLLVHYIPLFFIFFLIILELAVAVIQSYIFIVLSYFYLRDLFWHAH